MISFADKQTLDDLNIPGRHKNNSILSLFDTVVTTGGRKLMDQMFQNPLRDNEAINKRSSAFKYFSNNPVRFPFTADESEVMESYIRSAGGVNLLATGAQIVYKKLLQVAAQHEDYEHLNKEVCTTIELLNRLNDFANGIKQTGHAWQEQQQQIKDIFKQPDLDWLEQERGITQLSVAKLVKYDHRLRTLMQVKLKQLLSLIYELDVLIAVAGVSRERNFTYANALPKSANTLAVGNLFHPALKSAVGNDLSLQEDRNVIFLTGANMAGKSTLMKSFGICVYLAHMGFPVAASAMEFSVKDGLFSSINISDNIDMGYSHFYAEVLRVKTVAEQVAVDQDLVVIFDELFKGTNVKDAYDATLSITKAFSENRNCFFVISTHITEVGETLSKECNNFHFTYLPTVMKGMVPQYTYKLTEGITTDKHGMMIIENEGILDIIRSDKTKQS
ncbi:DNA mismatch repair protein [Mucilaginibacter sp. RS28]|uniref:DNA mismatch repair protein n=1 Tax=Mucilaginibacter straminoryzae TaxID=2932774 RepID=A0A9X2B8L5_9SPHI|nr:DNA mismatch repair protein [Mucilaginibacter straminoryzae]MCJ8208830.1 DNA mismatch repair protein [Mucilaginibacter straminoryzae]